MISNVKLCGNKYKIVRCACADLGWGVSLYAVAI